MESTSVGKINNVLMYCRCSYPWKPWLFSQVPKGYWKSADNVRQVQRGHHIFLKPTLQFLLSEFNIEKPEDYYTLSVSALCSKVVVHPGLGGVFSCVDSSFL